MYQCKCGKEYDNKQSYTAHCGHCKVNLGREPKDRFGDKRAWSKGLTKETSEVVRRNSIKHSEYLKNLGDDNPLVRFNRNKPKECYQNQSITRKLKYSTGELTPAKGVGRGKYSYLVYNNKSIMLRSTYEFIYALYLLYNDIDFEYELVRVSYEGKTFISDFKIGNKIIEIKGNYHADTSKQKLAFESSGFDYEVKFWRDLEDCYEYLKTKIDIDDLLNKIREGHDNKSYFKYEFS